MATDNKHSKPENGAATADEATQQNGESKGKKLPVTGAETRFQDPEELIRPLKELVVALERRQKVVQEVGDYQALLQRLTSGELLAGEELEQAKQIVQSLGKLIKATIDHQNAVAVASEVMPALDKILLVQSKKA